MAIIKTMRLLPFLRHCQGEVHTHLIVTRGGSIARQGRGLGFWFQHIGTAISEVPVNDQSVTATFKCRTQDFQEVAIAAQIWYLVDAPETMATRFDFSINTETGAYNADPLTVIQGALASAAQEAVWSHVASHTLESLLQSELSGLSSTVSKALAALEFGVQVTRAVVTAVRPERTVEEALQARTRERLQMEAAAAGFERRAKATEQERAIQEAELANRLALARRQQELIAQEAANQQAQAESGVAVALINVRGAMEGERQKAQLALETKQATDRASAQHDAAMADNRLRELERTLGLHLAHPGGASAIARTRTPEVLRNVKVLTLGSGGLQSALERLAPEPD